MASLQKVGWTFGNCTPLEEHSKVSAVLSGQRTALSVWEKGIRNGTTRIEHFLSVWRPVWLLEFGLLNNKNFSQDSLSRFLSLECAKRTRLEGQNEAFNPLLSPNFWKAVAIWRGGRRMLSGLDLDCRLVGAQVAGMMEIPVRNRSSWLT